MLIHCQTIEEQRCTMPADNSKNQKRKDNFYLKSRDTQQSQTVA